MSQLKPFILYFLNANVLQLELESSNGAKGYHALHRILREKHDLLIGRLVIVHSYKTIMVSIQIHCTQFLHLICLTY